MTSKASTPARRVGVPRVAAKARRVFLAELAVSCNVAGSANKAGVDKRPLYALRKACPQFYAEWQEALAEGYVRIEEKLLAEAIAGPRAVPSALAQKERERTSRIRMALLNAHRNAVRGGLDPDSELTLQSSAREKLAAQLDQMAERLAEGEAA